MSTDDAPEMLRDSNVELGASVVVVDRFREAERVAVELNETDRRSQERPVTCNGDAAVDGEDELPAKG